MTPMRGSNPVAGLKFSQTESVADSRRSAVAGLSHSGRGNREPPRSLGRPHPWPALTPLAEQRERTKAIRNHAGRTLRELLLIPPAENRDPTPGFAACIIELWSHSL